ncbi:MAG: glycoside hydrolase family 3 N-terminal domain-containing protein [Chitinophagaceae bacterium]|nr:glycoside hydrolase family 3 N-terminal domain-containing protein [Chitinophagaceae bacterium]
MKTKFLMCLFIFLTIRTYAQDKAGYFSQKIYFDNANKWVDSVLEKMTLSEKVGQLFLIAAYSNRDSSHEKELQNLIQKYNIGGLVVFQGGPARQVKMLNRLQKISKIPLLICMDAEWGVGMRLDSSISYPFQMTLGAIEDISFIKKMGNAIAQQLKKTGVDVNFAPVADINNNPNNPVISYRSFGENKEEVTKRCIAYMKGMEEIGTQATAKHFPGHGDTNIDSHYDIPQIPHNSTRLDTMELFPFKQLIDEGITGVMIAHLKLPFIDSINIPSSASPLIITDILKQSLQFKGIIYTDALNMKAITKYISPEEVALKALKAGNDFLELVENTESSIETIIQAVKNKKISILQIDSSCRKILYAKYFSQKTKWIPLPEKNVCEEINTPDFQLLNRMLFEKSITTLKNEKNCIPLNDLENLNLISISLGVDTFSFFQQRLNDYTEMPQFFLKKNATIQEITNIKNQIPQKTNCVILAIHQGARIANTKEQLSKEVLDFAQDIISSKKTILVALRNPYLIPNIPNFEKASVLITTYQDHILAQDMAAQAIFGGISTSGKLPVTFHKKYVNGLGIKTKGNVRFKFTIPEEIGINSKRLESRIDSVMQNAIQKKAFPGGQVLLAQDQKIFFHKVYGFHRYDSIQKITPTDIYDLASITKVTAGIPSIMKLYDERKIDLNGKLKTYYPYFKNSNKKNISLLNMLTHQAGLKGWIPFHTEAKNKDGSFKAKTLSTKISKNYPYKITDSLYLYKNYKPQLLKLIKNSPLNKEKKYLYSDLSFYLYPDIIKKITGENFEQYLSKNFYTPLGVKTMTYNAGEKFPIQRIIPTEVDTFFRMQTLHGIVHDEGAALLNGISSHAGLFAKATDLAVVWQMYLNGGKYGGKKYINPQTIQKFSTCQFCELGNRRGIGFDKPPIVFDSCDCKNFVARQTPHSSYGHSGYTGTFVWADPENKLLYIFLSNRVHPTRNNSLISDMNVRPTIHKIIYQELGF